MKPIPFRQRLVVRLALGMIGVALLSLLIALVIQVISLTLSNIQTPELEKRLQDLLVERPNDPELVALIETPFRIRNIAFRSGLLSLLVSGLLWIYFAVHFARSIASPIERVTQASAQITGGNLATRVRIPRDTQGESLQLLEHFNEMARSLETYEKERTAMIASIAHELRTPLSVMRTRLEVMEEGLVDFNQSEVRRLVRQVDLLTRLVNDLRTLSLVDADKLSLTMSQVDVAELVKNVTESFQARIHEQGIELELDLNSNMISADADRMAQVIYNLLDNAVKHTPARGKIIVHLIDHGTTIELHLYNSGTHFTVPSEQLFQRFYTTDHSGSGIGLAVVKSIVALHGGSILAVNVKEGGVRFSLTLPKSQVQTRA
jgi:signal transduction histidine kinase